MLLEATTGFEPGYKVLQYLPSVLRNSVSCSNQATAVHRYLGLSPI